MKMIEKIHIFIYLFTREYIIMFRKSTNFIRRRLVCSLKNYRTEEGFLVLIKCMIVNQDLWLTRLVGSNIQL